MRTMKVSPGTLRQIAALQDSNVGERQLLYVRNLMHNVVTASPRDLSPRYVSLIQRAPAIVLAAAASARAVVYYLRRGNIEEAQANVTLLLEKIGPLTTTLLQIRGIFQNVLHRDEPSSLAAAIETVIGMGQKEVQIHNMLSRVSGHRPGFVNVPS